MSATETEHDNGAETPEAPEDQEAMDAFNKLSDAEKQDLAARADEEGVTIEELVARGETEAPTPPMMVPLPGLQSTLSLSAGGKAPVSSEARLLGGSMPLEGQFPKGETVMLLLEAKVGSVEFVDKTDEWGTVQTTVRRHKMRMLSVKRYGE